MKEAWEVMGQHWAVTLWVGIVIMVSFHRVTIIKHHKSKDEDNQ